MDAETHDIPYFEYRAINQLIHAHSERTQFDNRLRAVIAFGDLIARGGTYDIALLEVVDDLGEAYAREYESTDSLPLRGKLFLYFLSTFEFEQSCQSSAPEYVNVLPEPEPTRALMERVLAGYEIIYEAPAGYAREHLQQASQVFHAFPAKRGINPFKPMAVSGKG